MATMGAVRLYDVGNLIVISLRRRSQWHPAYPDIFHYFSMCNYTEVGIYHALRRVYTHLNG